MTLRFTVLEECQHQLKKIDGVRLLTPRDQNTILFSVNRQLYEVLYIAASGHASLTLNKIISTNFWPPNNIAGAIEELKK